MTVMNQQQQQPQTTNRGSGSLYDVLELILDKGLVIDVFVRVSLVGIELLTVDARVVVASVDTYLRFAEACNRLDLTNNRSSTTLPELVGDVSERGARGKTKGALGGVASAFTDALRGGDDEEDGERERERDREREPAEAPRSRPRRRLRSGGDEEA